MKRIINGKAYNTATATVVVESDGSSSWSLGSWAMYQTRYGEFFEITVDHDGETILAFQPLDDSQAQAILEKRANHLVDKYFGPMPEGGSAESRLTIRLPANLASRLATVAAQKGLSLNAYAMRCLERGVTSDGSPPER